MSLTVRTESFLPVARELAWEVWSDLAGWHEWTQAILPVGPVPDDPWALGTRLRVRVRMPIALAFAPIIVESEPGRVVAWEGKAAGVVGVHRFAFEDAPKGGTHFVHEEIFTGPGVWLLRLIGGAGATERVFRVYNQDLERRSNQAEAQARMSEGLRTDL